jgi:hypothetical protein
VFRKSLPRPTKAHPVISQLLTEDNEVADGPPLSLDMATSKGNGFSHEGVLTQLSEDVSVGSNKLDSVPTGCTTGVTLNDCNPVTDEVEALLNMQVFPNADVGSTGTDLLVPPLPWSTADALYGCPCCADLYQKGSSSKDHLLFCPTILGVTPKNAAVTHSSGNSDNQSQCSMSEGSTTKSVMSFVAIDHLLAEDLMEPTTNTHHAYNASVTGGSFGEEGVHITETLINDMYDSSFRKAAFGQGFVIDKPPVVTIVTPEYIRVSGLRQNFSLLKFCQVFYVTLLLLVFFFCRPVLSLEWWSLTNLMSFFLNFMKSLLMLSLQYWNQCTARVIH